MHKNLSKKIKEYRIKHNLTQKELAKKLYVSDKAVSKWERENGLPDIETLIRLADLLGMTVEELLKEPEIPYYEYQSQTLFFHLPLMHLIIPRISYLLSQSATINEFFELIGNLPSAKGWFSLGVKAKGGISIGLACMGVMPIGVLSLGVIAFGGISVGLIGIGNLSLGMLVAIGNFALGVLVIGNLGVGLIVVANLAVAWLGIANQGIGSFIEVLPSNPSNLEIQQAIKALLMVDIPDFIKENILVPAIHFSETMQFIVRVVYVLLLIILSLLLIGLIQLRHSYLKQGKSF
jgi:transcriptional regulator with XRE-family HTH domain